jgi:hypothetical protein
MREKTFACRKCQGGGIALERIKCKEEDIGL